MSRPPPAQPTNMCPPLRVIVRIESCENDRYDFDITYWSYARVRPSPQKGGFNASYIVQWVLAHSDQSFVW